jgi:hypothetical protein
MSTPFILATDPAAHRDNGSTQPIRRVDPEDALFNSLLEALSGF